MAKTSDSRRVFKRQIKKAALSDGTNNIDNLIIP